jgi:hypothetical protein
MTKDEKQQFIGDLIATVRASIVARIDEMPEEWDGLELRRYIADKFNDEVFDPLQRGQVRGYGRSPRLTNYLSERIIRDI